MRSYDRMPSFEATANRAADDDALTIFIATGTQEKFKQLQSIFINLKAKAHIRPIFQLVDYYHSPLEESCSYYGNTKEKIDAALSNWDAMSREAQDKRLAALKIKRQNCLIGGEDSGLGFLEPLFAFQREFVHFSKELKARLAKSDLFPGVETGPVIAACGGAENFFNLIARSERRLARHGSPVNRDVVQTSHVMLVPLEYPRQIISHSASVYGTYRTDPRPSQGAIKIDHFIVPHLKQNWKKPERNGLTEAQRKENYYHHLSVKAAAIQGLITGLKLIPKRSEISRINRGVSDFRIGIITDRNHADVLPELKIPRDMTPVFLSPNVRSAAELETQIFDRADAFIIDFDAEQEAVRRNYMRNWELFSSAMVGKQTHDKHLMGKEVYLVNPSGRFDYFEKIMNDWYQLGALPQDPKQLFKVVDSVSGGLQLANQDRELYFRYDPPVVRFYERGLKSPFASTITLFLSASKEDQSLINDATSVALGLPTNYGRLTGAGIGGGMGGITRGLAGHPTIWHGGSNVPHIMQRAGGEGRVEDLMSYFRQDENIYARLGFLNTSGAAGLLDGATGTMQEWANRCVRELGKTTVIYNRPIVHLGRRRGFYDKLLETVPPGKLAEHNTTIVENTGRMIEELDRGAWEYARSPQCLPLARGQRLQSMPAA